MKRRGPCKQKGTILSRSPFLSRMIENKIRDRDAYMDDKIDMPELEESFGILDILRPIHSTRE